jgi:cobalt-zinc-cadmium efflux system protein
MGVVADIVGSSGVFIVGVVIVTTRWPYADVVAAVFVAVWVVSWAKGNRLSRPSGQL